MKTYLSKIAARMDFWNLFIGMVVGIGVGLTVFSALVPNGPQLIKLYHMETYEQFKEAGMNNDMPGMNHSGNTMNPYVMKKISSEKQFVEEMIMHHDAAVQMASEVLVFNPRAEVKKLANDIISAQTSEIKMMKEWLVNWK